MAIWQFDLYLVPESAMRRELASQGHGDTGGLAFPQEYTGSDFPAVDWWRDAALPESYRESLEHILPRRSSWANDWEIYGEEDANRIDVLLERGAIAEIRTRVDLRALDPRFIQEIAEFAREYNCVFVTLTGRFLPADGRILSSYLKTASMQPSDPERFNDRLRND